MSNFEDELSNLINRYSKENGCNTPDFILAQYLNDCLTTFNKITKLRDTWHGNKSLEAFAAYEANR